MRTTFRVWGAWLAVLLTPGVALAQRATSTGAASAPGEVWTLAANDGRNHDIEAIALVPSGASDVIYVLERAVDLFVPGSGKTPDGEYLLWKLDANGKVLRQEFIAKVSELQPARATITPLPAPQQGAVLIGTFDARYDCSMLRIDGDGKIMNKVKLIKEPATLFAAALLPDSSGLLLAGQRGSLGSVWKVDLDGKVVWEKTYSFTAKTNGKQVAEKDTSAPAGSRPSAQFYSIALSDDSGGFVVAGDYGEVDKFGAGQKSVWLVRCDAAGKIASESSFPGRLPAICPVAEGQCAVLYDASATMEFDGRLRLVNQEFEQKLETKAAFATFSVDRPALAPARTAGGFIVAGGNVVVDKENKPVRRECRIDQYNFKADVVSSVSIPVARNVILHTRVVSGVDRAYAAFQSKGLGFNEGREASVYEIHLSK